jgi:hypothetical protein
MVREKIRHLVFASLDKEYDEYRSSDITDFKTKQPEVYAAFLKNESLISELLKQTRYWHGTGRYQYTKHGDSKYAGVDRSAAFDVLHAIIDATGLKPHYDPWVGKFTTTTQSLSVANQWGY